MSKTLIGYIYLIASTIIYGLFGILSRYTSSFSPFSQTLFKYLFEFIIVLFIILIKKINWKNIEKKDIKWFLIWIIPCSFQPILTFVSFNHLSVGTTYFLIYSTMILGGILSGNMFFKEKIDLIKSISLFLVFIGLYLIYQSDLSLFKNIYVFLALLSGLTIGFWNTLSKKVSTNYSEFQMLLIDCSSAIVIGLIGFYANKEMLPSLTASYSWMWLLIYALLGVLASTLLIKGFKNVEAQKGSLILPMEIVFASLFGYFFFSEILALNIYIGGTLILLAAILPYSRMIKFTNHYDL